MRLSKLEVDVVKQSVYRHDPEALVYLFGSRADDTKKGGDIDLLIISTIIKPADKIDLKAAIYEKLEEQKIDIVVAKNKEKPFVRLALKQGVLL